MATIEMPERVNRRLHDIVDYELIGGDRPGMSLSPWDMLTEAERTGDPNAARREMYRAFAMLSDAQTLAAYLTEVLVSRKSSLRVERVPRWFFADGIYPVRAVYLGLVDPEVDTRRLFLLGPLKPAITWIAEDASGPAFEARRRKYEEPDWREELRREAENDAAYYLAPFAVRLLAYAAGLDLTRDQRRSIGSMGDPAAMGLVELAVICRVVGIRLERLFSNKPLSG